MSVSYTGDRLQYLAQAWLVATITGSALAVGSVALLSTLPLLLLPLAGVIADRVDRRKLLIVGQLLGAAATALVAVLVLSGRVSLWHIYAWALVNGVIALASRPAYKVMLTKSVPPEEVRPAVSINLMTETGALVASNAGGSVLLSFLGLPVAFVLNTASYVVAAVSLWKLPDLDKPVRAGAVVLRQVLSDLQEGLRYLRGQPRLFRPLLLTFVTVILITPAFGLLPAIVHAHGGSLVLLGMLAAANSIGSFAGAAYAGFRAEGESPSRTYALFGLLAAVALAAFALFPVTLLAALPLAVLGFVALSQAAWNTSRIGLLAEEAYGARLQAVTSMAFTLGFPIGMLWGGLVIDLFGTVALVGAAGVLGIFSLLFLLGAWSKVS